MELSELMELLITNNTNILFSQITDGELQLWSHTDTFQNH